MLVLLFQEEEERNERVCLSNFLFVEWNEKETKSQALVYLHVGVGGK
jgi:hypothetical protein